jgi:hypothetical protein
MDANLKDLKEDIKSSQAEMRYIVDARITDIKNVRKKTTTCQEVMGSNPEKTESGRGMMQSVAEHQVVPKEDAIVKPVKGQEKRHSGRKPAAGRHGEPKELYHPQMRDDGDCGAVCGMKIGRGNRSTRRKPAPAPLCPSQIPLDMSV